jgi:electron transport complex protein RnfB
VLESLNNLLPQTQCGQCSFNGCRPYAEAIMAGDADINQCPPSGDAGIARIAALLGIAPKPLNLQFGEHKPKSVAVIDEAQCIGCVKCIAACPVDAIIGAAKYMHTVISAECTGCELCVAPCPIDCISIVSLENPDFAPANLHAKQRYETRNQRKEKDAIEKSERLRQQKARLLAGH